MPTCISLCLWKEWNFRCFKDLERSLEDILASFFHTLYLWTMTFVSPLSLSFDDFFFFSFLVKVFPFVYFQCTQGCLMLLVRIDYYLLKKKKFFISTISHQTPSISKKKKKN